MIDSTNPRAIADNIRHLSGESESQASDISSLQTMITALGSYSADEVDTGKKWIDGSTIYRKVFYKELPNNSTDSYAHGIENLGVMVAMYGVAQNVPGWSGRPLGIIGSGVSGLIYSPTNIGVSTSGDMSGKYYYLIIEYTKSGAPSALTSPAPDDSRSIEPEIRSEEIESEVVKEVPEEEPVAETKTTTRKKSTSTK